jgi:hypothetical protein
MKRYKISKENLNEFWGLFGKKKPQSMQQVIDNDPVLNKLDDELYDINRSYIPKLQKIKDTQPENWKQLVKYGLVDPKDFK